MLNLAYARLLIFSFALTSSGVPLEWAATEGAPGINLLPDLSEASASEVADRIVALKRPGDLIVVSIHWDPIGDITFRTDRRSLPEHSSTRRTRRSFMGIRRTIRERSKSIGIVSFCMAAVIF